MIHDRLCIVIKRFINNLFDYRYEHLKILYSKQGDNVEFDGYMLYSITVLGIIQVCYFVFGWYIGRRAKKTSQRGVYFLSLQMIFLGASMVAEILGIILQIQYLGYTVGILPMICALIFVHKVFYSEKESPIKKFFPI